LEKELERRELKMISSDTFLEGFLGKEVDVEFGVRPHPNRIYIDILEDGVISKSVCIFREDDNKIYVSVTDSQQWDDGKETGERPGPKQIHLLPIIDRNE
jgi:hypothetical protein